MSAFLIFGLLAVLFISSSEGGEKKLIWQIGINEECKTGLIENDKTSTAFKEMKKKVEDGIRYVYRNNSDFDGCSIIAFKCRATLIVGIEVRVANNTNITLFTKIFKDDVRDNFLNISANSQLSIPSYDVSIGSFKLVPPVLYAKISGTIANDYFCDSRSIFKNNLAGRLILMDGYSTASADQIIIFNHACGNVAAKHDFFQNIQFYISKNGLINMTDTKLTLLAFKVIEQMIYDGTTWRLGIHLYKYLDKINLMGKEAPDFGLADVQIVFIGVGAVAVLILLIIIVVYTVSCYNNGCCKKDFEEQISIDTSNGEKGITNELFEKEVHAASPRDKAEDQYKHEEMPMQVIRTSVSDYPHDTVDERPSTPDYDNYTAYDNIPLADGMMSHAKDSDFDTDDEDDEDQDDDGKDLNLDALVAVVYDTHGLNKEFDSLSKHVPNSILYPPECDNKNRVKGSFPWPETRVVLSTDDKDHESIEDYINASFVKGDNVGKPVYIATQAPLESTTNDFWKMVWEQNVAVIVMATPLKLKEKELCCQYWPPDQIARRYDRITVQLIKKELKPDFLVITVVASNELETRHIYLFRYMSWPNSRIPDNTKSIVGFLLEIREVCDTTSSPPVFHCSSGIGMSATFIAIIRGMLSLEKTHVVNVKRIVRLLRNDLAGGVETPDQYRFLYAALYQYAQFNS